MTVRKGAGDTLLIVHVTATDPQMDRQVPRELRGAAFRSASGCCAVPGVGDVGVNARATTPCASGSIPIKRPLAISR